MTGRDGAGDAAGPKEKNVVAFSSKLLDGVKIRLWLIMTLRGLCGVALGDSARLQLVVVVKVLLGVPLAPLAAPARLVAAGHDGLDDVLPPSSSPGSPPSRSRPKPTNMALEAEGEPHSL